MRHSQILKMTFLVVSLLFATSCATENALMQTPKPEPPTPVVKVSTIQKISFTEEENYTRIQIEGSETIAPPFYKLLFDPRRIAIDIPNIDLKQIKSPLKIENGTIGEVLTTQYDDKGRIEIGLIEMANYNVTKEEKNLIIDIEKVKRVVEVKEVKTEDERGREKVVETPLIEKKQEANPPLPSAGNPHPGNMQKAKEIVEFSLENKEDFIIFSILADGKIGNYNAFKLDSPPRLVLDIWEVDTRKDPLKIKNPFIKKVRVGHYPDKLRLVFDSQKLQLPPYQVSRADDKLMVSLGNIPQPSEPQIYVQERSEKDAPATSLKAQTQTRPKPGKPSTLTSIDFKQMDHKSRIVLSLSAEDPQFESSTPSKDTIVIDVKDAFAPKRLLRGLDTSAFETAVNYIDLKNVKVDKGNDIRISVRLKEETAYEATKEGKEIFIDIKERPKKIEARVEAPPPEVKKDEVMAEPKKEDIRKEEVKRDEKPIPESRKAEKESLTQEQAVSKEQVTKGVDEGKKVLQGEPSRKVYGGRKLSLDFKDADIRNILRLIAEVSDLNIIAADDVAGKITMRLVDVPWDQALEIILQSKNLGMTRVGNVVRVAPLEALKREAQGELEAKRAKERLEDLVMELIPVNYATAKEIMPQVKSVLSERGDIKVDDRTNTLIIKDIPKSIPGVKNLVRSLDTKTPQVLIEARIIEASLSFQRELGVKWGFLTGGGKATVGGGNVGASAVTTPPTVTHNVVDLPALARTAVPGATATSGIIEAIFSRGSLKVLDIAISAHENQGDVRIISCPKIATLDNKEASVEQGLRVPYLKLTTEGTVTTDFIDANLKLTVTPHVTNDGTIKMILKVKKDAPDWNRTVEGVPSIDKKEAISEVLVKDNGVVVIAGVYSIEKDNSEEGIPLFKKIPLLGWLFKRETKDDLRKDLLIFISPKILKDEI